VIAEKGDIFAFLDTSPPAYKGDGGWTPEKAAKAFVEVLSLSPGGIVYVKVHRTDTDTDFFTQHIPVERVRVLTDTLHWVRVGSDGVRWNP
jgi:vacuolar-type H+-ATPase subunit I/STV1